ncbi:MAG: DNA-binding response regulator [Planctomycetota bacterium]|nr:MAG: DNA-binding response regulator [Planctomycetota bacterium]
MSETIAMGARTLPGEIDPGALFSLLIASLRNASALILDDRGVIVWRCCRIGRLLCHEGEVIGSRLDAIVPGTWARERYALIDEAHRTGHTKSLYSIWLGVRTVTRFVPISAGGHAWTMAISESATPEQMKEELARGGDAVCSKVNVLGPLEVLTGRELQVLALLGQGLRPKEIATALNRSISTVEGHRERIGQKLGVHDRAELLLMAQRAGLRLEDADAERGVLALAPKR